MEQGNKEKETNIKIHRKETHGTNQKKMGLVGTGRYQEE
jgi:hypothetical protein